MTLQELMDFITLQGKAKVILFKENSVEGILIFQGLADEFYKIKEVYRECKVTYIYSEEATGEVVYELQEEEEG